jgi:hypothetical protein
LGPIPNPQSPIPNLFNSVSVFKIHQFIFIFIFKEILFN